VAVRVAGAGDEYLARLHARKLKKGGCCAPGGVFFQDIGIASLKT
jgi:hypothetical protein